MNRMMTAEEIAAEIERGADNRAADARDRAVSALASAFRTTPEFAETWVREIEDAVRRDCARRCEGVREALRKADAHYARVAPVVVTLSEGMRPSLTMPTPTVYRGPAAGADACVEAIRDEVVTR